MKPRIEVFADKINGEATNRKLYRQSNTLTRIANREFALWRPVGKCAVLYYFRTFVQIQLRNYWCRDSYYPLTNTDDL